jgi:putative DNA primase/helicase
MGEGLIMQDDSVVKNQVEVEVEGLVDGEVGVRQLAADVASATEAFEKGNGPDLEDEHRRRAQALGISDAALTERWKKAKASWAERPRPKPRLGVIGFPVKKPKPPEQKVANEAGPQIEAAPSVSAKPRRDLSDIMQGYKHVGAAASKLEPEVEVEVEEEAEGAVVWKLPKLATQPELSRTQAMENAKSFTRDKLSLNGVLATYHYQDKFWQWNQRFYERAPEQRIINLVCHYLDGAMVRTEGGTERFRPAPKHVDALMKFLKPCVGLDDRLTPPRWLNTHNGNAHNGNAENLLVFRNCMIDAVTGEDFGLTPQFWCHDGVDFDYNPKAKCPTWDWFLDTIFPDDEEAQMTIEEQLGYAMTYDNQFEKAAMWIGEPRSGRGTLARIQELLVGSNAHIPLDFHTWHRTENSRMGMVGKKVGIFHDVRLKPGKAYGMSAYDPGGMDHQSMQALLEFIAGDAQTIPRKWIEAWIGLPMIRLIFISNKVPNLQNDQALISRFITLYFAISFLDRDRPEIKRDLLPAELPGIANRCLAAYRRLLARGRFLQPKSGLTLLERVREEGNPYLAFMNASWAKDPEALVVRCSEFHETFQDWCRDNERHDLIRTSKSRLIQEVNKIPEWKHLKATRAEAEDNVKKPRRYPGIRPR